MHYTVVGSTNISFLDFGEKPPIESYARFIPEILKRSGIGELAIFTQSGNVPYLDETDSNQFKICIDVDPSRAT